MAAAGLNTDQLLQVIGDIAYSRTVFCRRALTNPQLDTLLSNEARMLRLLERDSYNNIITSFMNANIPINVTHGTNAFWDPVTVAASPAHKEKQLDGMLFLGADYIQNTIRKSRTGPLDSFFKKK